MNMNTKEIPAFWILQGMGFQDLLKLSENGAISCEENDENGIKSYTFSTLGGQKIREFQLDSTE